MTPHKPIPSHPHPLDPLSAQEIRSAVSAIRAHIASSKFTSHKPITRALFNSVSLKEPSKYAVLAWSGLFPEEELRGVAGEVPVLKRQAEASPSGLHFRRGDNHLVLIICPESGQSFEAIVDFPSNLAPTKPDVEPTVTRWEVLDALVQPSLQAEELLWAEEVCKRDPLVKAACEEVGIKQEDIAVDGWCIGADERFPGRRLQQCFAFVRLREGDNLYAHPCDFVPVIDSHTGKVLTIDYPHLNPSLDAPLAPSSQAAHTAAPPRARFPPPATPSNYLPDQLAIDDPTFKVRDSLKPLHVVQPEGVSFRMEGRTVSWQNWRVHVGFSYREGLVLSNLTYDDGAKGRRPLFYRLSIAEMVVPYGKPTFPHHRKHAFDTGEYGIGALANSLQLGCDCLGSITYLDADFVTRAGGVETIKSAICIHEEDAGILHKHTDFRDLRAHLARNRKLVISSIHTVANYEYGFYYNFSLDGSVELEIKATGIVNAYALAPGEAQDPAHEVEVAPRVVAHHHQHLFSCRIDPMIDGLLNQVVQVDTIADEAPLGSAENYYGNGFRTVKTLYETSRGSVSRADGQRNRTWTIENPGKQHFSSGDNVGYRIVCKDMPPLLAKPGSLVWKRAPFARSNMFVTPFAEDELYPAGVHINQHPGGEAHGIQEWVNRDEGIVNRDIVCWPCFGVTHISRPEDWPIMPVETVRLHLKPSGFFDRNPGLDVPSSADTHSRHAVEATNGVIASSVGAANGHAGRSANASNANHGHGANGHGGDETNGSAGCC